MGDAANIMLGPVVLLRGTAGTTPATPMGYTTEDGTEFFPDEEVLDVKVGEKLGIVKQFAIEAKGTLSCSLIEMTLDNLAAVLPAATRVDSNTLERLVANTSMTPISIKAVGLNALGNVRTYLMLYANGKLKSGVKLSARELAMLEAEFGGLAIGTSLWKITDGASSNIKTIATGAFARTTSENYYRVAGEGAAADVLDDITGTIANNEVFIIQPYDAAGQPITVTHASGVIELEGEVDFVMDNPNDTLWLQYNTSGTKWVEIARRSGAV